MYTSSVICTSYATVNLKYLIQSNMCHIFRHLSVVKQIKTDSVKKKSAIRNRGKIITGLKLSKWNFVMVGMEFFQSGGSVLSLPEHLNSQQQQVSGFIRTPEYSCYFRINEVPNHLTDVLSLCAAHHNCNLSIIQSPLF